MSHTVNLYRSTPIHLSFVLYVLCITLGTAGVVYCEEKERQPFLFVKNTTFKSNEMACSAFSGNRRNVIHCNFLHTCLNMHWLFQLSPSVRGGDFPGIKFGLCYGFSSQWRDFFCLPSGRFETGLFSTVSTMFAFISFCILLISSPCSSYHSCVTVLLISVRWLTCQ